MKVRSLVAALALSMTVLAAPMAYAAPNPTPSTPHATAIPQSPATASPTVTPTRPATPSPIATPTPTRPATPSPAATPTRPATPMAADEPTPAPTHPVDAKYAALGGASGFLGAPTNDLWCGLVNAGCFRTYQGGSIYWTSGTGAHVVGGAILQKWGGLGWEAGKLGYPTTDETCTARGCVQSFGGGQVTFSSRSGTHAVLAPIVAAYEGSATGPLAYARGEAWCGLVRSGCTQEFEGGSIYWSPETGARWTRGAINDKWASTGWEAGFLGYPTSNEECWIANGCFQRFQGGLIYFNPAAGTHFTYGAVFDEWGRTGWEGGHLGFPTSDVQCWIKNGCFQDFQGGHIYWSAATGARWTRGAIFDHWGRNGWEAGHLGYPTSGEFCGLRAGGCGQHFQHGSIYWSPKHGVHFVKGAIKQKWSELGWERDFGFPKTDEICGMKNGGCRQVFEGDDSIYWSKTTGAHPVFREFMQAWGHHGWEGGRIGYPVDDPYRSDQTGRTEYGIEFQGAFLYFFAEDPGRVLVQWK